MHEKQIEKLIAQVKDLTTLKKEHEDALLLKFQELLNSKKQRIRDLNRIIEGRGVSPKLESIGNYKILNSSNFNIIIL